MYAMYFKKQVWKYDLKEQRWHYVMSTMSLYYLFKKYLFWYKYIYKQICIQQAFLSLQTIIFNADIALRLHNFLFTFFFSLEFINIFLFKH